MKYICLSCHYVHDDEKENAYEDETVDYSHLDKAWTCPLCGATRDFFVQMV